MKLPRRHFSLLSLTTPTLSLSAFSYTVGFYLQATRYMAQTGVRLPPIANHSTIRTESGCEFLTFSLLRQIINNRQTDPCRKGSCLSLPELTLSISTRGSMRATSLSTIARKQHRHSLMLRGPPQAHGHHPDLLRWSIFPSARHLSLSAAACYLVAIMTIEKWQLYHYLPRNVFKSI